MADAEDYYDGEDEIRYESAERIDSSALPDALRRLTLFGDDLYLSMQATNLGLVDGFCMQLETSLMRLQMEQDGTPALEATFLSAQSQMWIFAAYEALRTWRQRAREIVKWSENGALPGKISELRKDMGFRHTGREIRASQLEKVLTDPKLVQSLKDDQKRVHFAFGRMHMLRIALAKHEESGRKNSVAYAPGYGRINMWCGAIDFELSVGRAILGTVNRRDIADELRALRTMTEIPSDESIASFDAMMKGPPDDLFDDLRPPESP